MAFEQFISTPVPKGRTGLLTGMRVGEIRACLGKTRQQVAKAMKHRIKKYKESFSWDVKATPIQVRRDS
jgi:hypothetical protein